MQQSTPDNQREAPAGGTSPIPSLQEGVGDGNPSPPITRLAPSPTGALHLGNARTFLINWAMARQQGWRIVLRIEDLDTPRVKPETVAGTIDLLRWLGMDWDEGPYLQSEDLPRHLEAMRELAAGGHVFPSELTRRQIAEAASAPHDGDGPSESRFGAELRPPVIPREFDDPGTSWRFITEDVAIEFDDGFAGRRSVNPAQSVGDFVVWTKNGAPAYQLAVVVDDAAQGVSRIVRGDDLLDSTARQILLQRALGISPRPRCWHLPLVLGPDGRRLAKRHGDTRLDHYRSRGVAPERVIGLVASWCGMPARQTMSAGEFASWFDVARLGRTPIRLQEGDEAWLRQ
ncbi:MAG: tRNA glutamyl-Q(34) synthetase GluQRS [Phycisphaeraceae bacterium]|nr:tRNA glutamyl-Q(34) synthetase GluQRS [Phycisphaeraceae bacterium]